MALYSLAENCDYGEEMIRDRLVVGIRDVRLSQKIQLDSKLTLETAKKTIRQSEAVHEQQHELHGEAKPSTNLDALHPQRSQKPRHRIDHGGGRRPNRPETAQCGRCGRGQHPREMCPAKDSKCHKCQRKGHFSALCYSKTTAVSSVQEEVLLDTAFLDTVSGGKTKSWTTTISLNGQKLKFKLDTGAEVTAVSKATWQVLGKPELQQPNRHLSGPAGQQLQVRGYLMGRLSHKGKHTTQQVFVVDNLSTNLLGLPSITTLGLVARVDATSLKGALSKEEVKKNFPKIFQGLGNLGEEYHVKLRPDAEPYALFAPRRIPLPLRPKVIEELERMEKAGVISKVTEPTPWCAGMVVVPKKSGAVRICVDLKPLNKSVLREVHPLPKVDETLAQLADARIFSKLDANSGFWQIPLSKPSRLLTTFITPTWRYCFNKLPFGISSAPEHFQRRMSELLSGLEGVLCQMDDILVFGKDQSEHDTRLKGWRTCR